jgi:TRAP transporter TAXI family solute receptor
MKRLIILTVTTLVCLLTFTHPASAQVTIKASAGQIGGGWYTIVSGLGEIINDVLKDKVSLVVVPGSGVSNIATCSLGHTPITMSFPPFIVAANKGIDPYDQKYPKTKVIAANFGTSAQHFVTTRKDIATYEDIAANKLPIKVCLNKPGATDEFLFRKVLEYLKVDYKIIKKWGGKVFHVGHGESVTLLKDGHADSHFAYISVPAASITEMAISRNLVFTELSDEMFDFLNKEWSLAPFTIPAGTYKGQTKDLRTLGMSNTLMANEDVDADLVYAITKTICENYQSVRNVHKTCSTWKPEMGPQGVEKLLHPGAVKYYQEKGYLK